MRKGIIIGLISFVSIPLLVIVIYFAIPFLKNNYTPLPIEDNWEVLDEHVLGDTNEKTIKVPVLMYHNIDAVPKKGSKNYKGLFVSPAMFKKQMEYLRDKGYKTLTPTEFHDILKSGTNPHKRAVLITFDDGSKGQYKYAYPVLKKLGMTATFYIISDRSPITEKQMKEMADAGMVIDSHTSTHPDLKKLKDKNRIKSELSQSKRKLEKITGKEIKSIAYPGCVADDRTFQNAEKQGYLLGFSCGRSIYHKYSKRYFLSRVHIYSDMESFKRTLEKGL